MSRIIIPENLKGKELFKFLRENKSKLIAQKKASLKYTDEFCATPTIIFRTKKHSLKAAGNSVLEDDDNGVIHVKVVCNTAWWCDSQMDVLTDKCYDKSIKDKGILIPHIADHVHTSTNHVGDVTDIYTQVLPLRELGYDMDGKTTALIMETDVREDYNKKTFRFYKNGKINQHSIGLQYVSIGLCLNDEEDLPHYELWKKYYDSVINKDVVDEYGYFWIVPEIKLMENSCVLFGSNELTPTLEVSPDTDDSAGKAATEPQPPIDKQQVICPNCQKIFKAPDEGLIQCPDCGQFVSIDNNRMVIDTFSVVEAIEKTNFFNS